MIQIDDWKEILTAGLIILAALAIVFGFLRWFLARPGSRIKVPGAEIDGTKAAGAEGSTAAPCAPYVAEHTATLARIEKKLGEMDAERQAARAADAESKTAMLKMIKQLMYSEDALIDALQTAKIGNGNLGKAREGLAACADIREGYLIDSLAACGG
jgi:hypothetical protein